MVYLLKKSLYGLKQSPRQWYLRFDEFMVSNGYLRSSYDSCVYIKWLANAVEIFLLLYVDDMLIEFFDRFEIDRLKEKLSVEFEMKDLGDVKRIFGMDITRYKEQCVIKISQKSYFERILGRFGMKNAKTVMTPIA